MKNKRTLVALVLLLTVGIVAATYAYFTSTAILNNEFKTGTYATSVTEEFVSPDNWTPGTTTPKKVNVTNKGTVDVAVRATYKESWTAEDGTKLDLTRDGVPIVQFIINEDWKSVDDGYYYYNDVLSTNETSTDFISSVTFNPNFKLKEGIDIECATTEEEGKTTIDCRNLKSGYAGATYRLDITLETVQADQKWNIYRDYEIGEEIIIDGEEFNVISDNGDTVSMLAKYNIVYTNYSNREIHQTDTTSSGDYEWYFTDSYANETWEAATSPLDLDVQSYGIRGHINSYVAYLGDVIGDTSLEGTLITLKELKKLGCDVPDNYAEEDGETYTCNNSEYSSWIYNAQQWWTRSAVTGELNRVWYVYSNDGYVGTYNSDDHEHGIRPVIIISKSTLENL